MIPVFSENLHESVFCVETLEELAVAGVSVFVEKSLTFVQTMVVGSLVHTTVTMNATCQRKTHLLSDSKRVDIDVDIKTEAHLVVLTTCFHPGHFVKVVLLQLLDIKDIFKENVAHLVGTVCVGMWVCVGSWRERNCRERASGGESTE